MKRDSIDINSNDNALFVTSRCNNQCLMCCQPPYYVDDIDFFYDKNIKIIDSADKNLKEIGITGGEPTLLNERFFSLLSHISKSLPYTHIQVLSNGRKFSDFLFTLGFNDLIKNQLLISIPIHSDFAGDHDKITQVKGSYDQTLHGLYNLGRLDVPVEIRIVINKMNHTRLPKISSFLYKQLPFAHFVSFMGMETTGWAIDNQELVWIDPYEYKQELEIAVLELTSCGVNTSIFNIPHCLLPESLHPYAVKSISDWKVTFFNKCMSCKYLTKCCGLFETSKIHSQNLKTHM